VLDERNGREYLDVRRRNNRTKQFHNEVIHNVYSSSVNGLLVCSIQRPWNCWSMGHAGDGGGKHKNCRRKNL